MANLLVDERDQQFVLNEMLEVEKLCEKPIYADFSKDMFDMVMTEAQKLAVNEIFPTLVQSRQGRVPSRERAGLRPRVHAQRVQAVLRGRVERHVFSS